MHRILILGACALIAGCDGTPAGHTSSGVPLDSLRAEFESTVEANDYGAQASLYATDAVLQPSNRPALTGRPAILEAKRAYLTSVPDATIDYEPTVAGQGGDYAWEAGEAFETGTDASGVAHADTGKYLWIWQRSDDGWRIVAHSFSLDVLPAPFEVD